jgi:hypothetical protein
MHREPSFSWGIWFWEGASVAPCSFRLTRAGRRRTLGAEVSQPKPSKASVLLVAVAGRVILLLLPCRGEYFAEVAFVFAHKLDVVEDDEWHSGSSVGKHDVFRRFVP